MRLGAIFVAVCMVIIAGSAGAIVYFYFGVGASEAATVAIATLTALALYNTVSARLGAGTTTSRQLADLSHGVADLARQVAEIGRRLAVLEGRVETAVDRTRGVTDPLSAEIDELGGLLRQLAETVAVHQRTLDALANAPAPVRVAEGPAQHPPADPAPPAPAEIPRADEAGRGAGAQAAREAVQAARETAAREVAATRQAAQAAAHEAAMATIRAAIDGNRIDLYLQPIVTLPQRKVRYYEAMSRLRNERGEVVPATEFVPQAESGGLMPKIDNLVIFRCVQVVRRLLLKNRDVGLFCNLSGSTLTDSAVFPQFLEFMDANRAIAPSLVLEFRQSAVRAMGPIEHEGLAALSERGFHFSMDNVTDLRIEPRELANRGFRFIKISANLLLSRGASAASDIHPADLPDLVGRFGIDLIAEKIESEGSVVDLLDCDLRYGQGNLFSPPRPVRAEALQGIADRSDLVETGAEQAPPASTAARVPEAPAAGKAERLSGLVQLARGTR